MGLEAVWQGTHRGAQLSSFHFQLVLRILAGEAEENAEQGYHPEDDGIVEIPDDVERCDGCEAGSHEELGTIGDESLGKAAEGVEQRGAHAVVHTVAVGDVACHRAYGDEGNGVVGRAEVGQHHEQGDSQLGTALTADAAGEHADEPVYTAIMPYEGKHAACQEGDDDELAHAHDALVHGTHPAHEAETTANHTDDTCQKDADKG